MRRCAHSVFASKILIPNKFASPPRNGLVKVDRASSKPAMPPAPASSLTRSPSWLIQSASWPLLSASAHPYLSRCPTRSHRHQGRLNNEVKLAFGQGDLSWKPGHLRSASGAICCKRFKPQNMTDDLFLAKTWGTNSCRGPRPSQ